MRVPLTGHCYKYEDFACGDVEPEEGDLLLKAKTDAAGLEAMIGGHTNYGFSGFFIAYLFAKGGSRRLLNYKELWPNEENRFAKREDMVKTMAQLETKLSNQVGREAVKTKGGWELR